LRECCAKAGEDNRERTRSLLHHAKIASDSSNDFSKGLKPNDEKWMTIYTLRYDSLRILTEAYLLLGGVYSTNHICLFSALCTKHPELELDWKFFEKIRTKRNGANYYGEIITHVDFKEVELQMKLYESTLRNEIEKKLKK